MKLSVFFATVFLSLSTYAADHQQSGSDKQSQPQWVDWKNATDYN